MLDLLNSPVQSSKEIDVLNEQISTVHRLYQELKPSNPNRRARDFANDLGITEAQWVASQCGG